MIRSSIEPFDSAAAREIRVGDRVLVRFNPADDEESVFVQFS
jgi:hypothetical protein